MKIQPPRPVGAPRLVLRALLWSCVLAILALGCSRGSAGAPVGMAAPEEQAFRAAPAPPAQAAKIQASTPAPEPEPADAPVIARKLIRRGSMSVEVDDVPSAAERVQALVEQEKGYIGDRSESQDYLERRSASLVCRVPAERLDALIDAVKALGKTDSVQISAEDVTEQYVDLEIQLATQRKLAERLNALLSRPSNELKDLLEIERELARVHGEIDQMEGRKRYWDNQVALSTLEVQLHEPTPALAGGEGGPLRVLLRSFRQAGDNFVQAVAWLIATAGALAPILVVALVVIWLIARWRRRRRGKVEKKSARAEIESQ